jgi:hypothetical protein
MTAIHIDSPPSQSSNIRILVACPDCAWWQITDRVPLDCGQDFNHRRPQAVHAHVACSAGCWDDWFDRLPSGCSADPRHQLNVTQYQFH